MDDRVLIAGAGPAGMVAAMQLATQGIPVTVCEALDALPTDLRASTFHPPTMDLLDRFDGLMAELIDWGLIAPTWQYRDRKEGVVATYDMGLLADESGHPYRLQAEQWKLTLLLEKRLRDIPHAELLFEHEALGARQDGDHAYLKVKTPDGEKELKGRFVVGADGANSAVRRSNDIAFDGITFPEFYVTLSTDHEFARDLPGLTYVNYIADPSEWLVLLRTVQNWRVLLPTDGNLTHEQILDDENVQRRLNAVAPQDKPFNVLHKTIYRVHERVADQYALGRILLAGDAAHINNPLGGMGMNGGIQDAFNLAEKLVEVWQGGEADQLLGRYERQRKKVAKDFVQQNAIRNREQLRESDPELRRKRHDEMRRVAEDPKLCKEFLLRSSMIAALREAAEIE